MRTPGRGFFTGGAIGMIVTGLLHFAAQLREAPPGVQAAQAAMREFTVTAGLTWSLSDAYHALSFSYAAFSVLIGAIDLYVLRVLRPTGPSLAGLAVLNALGAAVLAAIVGAHSVAPPLLCYAVVAALFTVAAGRARTTA